MHHQKLVWFFLLIIVPITHQKSRENDINLIKNYLNLQTKSIQVLLYVECWNKRDTYKLVEEVGLQRHMLIMKNFTKISQLKNIAHILIICDSSCEGFNFLLQQAESFELLKLPFKWFILSEKDFIPSSTNILIDSSFTVATRISKDCFHLKLLYKLKPNDKKFITNEIGIFSEEKFVYYNEFSIARNRSNLMGSNLTVSYVVTNPSYPFDVTHYRHRHIDGANKVSYMIVFHMLEMLNCTKVFIQRDSWGYKAENDTFYDGGMFGDIQNGTAEIGGTVAFYTRPRLDIVEYVAVTTPSNFKFILKSPPLSYVQNIITLPFQLNVWYCLYVVMSVTVVILYVIVLQESRNNVKKLNNIDNTKPFFFDVVMVQIGAITQQGSETESKSYSGRLAMFTTFLVLMFFYNAYSANIVVLLQSSSNNIRNVQDLLESKISLGVENIIYSKHYFPHQKEPIRKAIYEKRIAPKDQKPNYMSLEEGMKKVQNQFFAFHVETTSGYKVVMDTFQQNEKCGLTEVDYLNVLWPSISVKKHSPYRKIVKVGKICESGIRHRHVNRIYFKKPECLSKDGTFTSVGLVDIQFSLKIFGVGVSIAVCLVILEIFFKKYWARFFEYFK